ncbi:LIC_10190 family membrane protein [Chryseobacterium binzhouense]|uniref:LIC_10190 family membrane protein n=1 Tax=Chryseobacterium binzhouense TaxID=2593646 RepID=UPI002897E49F|nr:hypothetical protein [Chryseobacterium binzhouense]
MLLLFFSSVFIIPTLIGWGKLLEKIIPVDICGIAGKSLSGILALGLIFAIVSFFVPLNLMVEIPAVIIGLAIFFKEKLYEYFYKIQKKNLSILILFILIILYCGSSYPFILDHFGYYIPTIKWLTEVGIVKGISNLDLILGQMSVWHILQAGFSNFCDPFFKLNSVLLIIYIFYIIENKTWIHLIFIPFLLFFAQSPSPDLPVVIFSLIIVNEIFSGSKNIPFLFGLAVFAFAVKPTVIWLPLFVLLYSAFSMKMSIRKLVFGSFIFSLFIFKNIWTFGYPIFPVAVLDLGIPWKPNPQLLQSSSEYAILKTYDGQYTYNEIIHFSWFDYIKNWFLLSGIKSFINIAFILGLTGFIIYAFIKKEKIISLLVISVLAKSIFVLLFSAQYRFFLDVFFVIFFVIGFQTLQRKAVIAFSILLMIIFSGIFTFPAFIQNYIPSFNLGKFIVKKDLKQLFEPTNYEYRDFNRFKVGNLNFNVSKQYPFNFETPIPAISTSYVLDYQKAKIFPQLIDKNNFRKGFIWKKLDSTEEKEVNKTIDIIKNDYR